MSKVRRLEKAHSALEKKSKATEVEHRHSKQNLADLNTQQQLLKDARQSCETRPGEKISPLSCWSRNQFVELLESVSVLLDEKIQQESNTLDQINQRLTEERRMTGGMEYLKDKEVDKIRQKHIKDELQETDRLLQAPSRQF